MKSRIYSADYVKSISKGRLWIPAFFSFGFLMAFVVAELMKFGNWFSTDGLNQEGIRILYEELWRYEFAGLGFVVIACGAVVNGVNHFWYLYSPEKTDFYHSLPVKRSKMFRHRTYIGILYYLIPYMVMAFLAVCIGAMRGFFSLKIVGLAFMLCLEHLILYLLFYFSAVLVVCVTGNVLMGALCFIGVFFYGAALEYLIIRYRCIFFNTYYSDEVWGLQAFLKEYASPFSLGKNLVEAYSGKNFIGMLMLTAGVTAVLGLLAYLAYVKRPSESSGKPVVYSWIGTVIKFMVVVPCGLGIGWIFYYLPAGDSRRGWWIFGMVLGTVFSHGIIEVIYQRDFRGFFSKKLHLVMTGVLVAACGMNYQMDLLGFDTYLPKQEKLAAININIGNQDNYLIIQQEDGSYHHIGAWTSEEAAVTGENGVGAQTWQVLKQIVESGNKEGAADEADIESRMEYMSEHKWRYSVPVKYTLNSGRVIYRNYLLTNQNIHDLYLALYEEGRLKENITSFFEMDGKYVTNIHGFLMSGDKYSLFQEEQNKYQELLNAVREDFREASPEELLDQPLAKLTFEYRVPAEKYDTFGTNLLQELNYTYYYPSVWIYPSFKRTIAILEETGYPICMEKFPLEKVVMIYYNEAPTDLSSVRVDYKDKTELEEIKKAIIPMSLCCSWISYESDMEAEILPEEGQEWSNYCCFLRSDKVPEFVKQKGEELAETAADGINPDLFEEAGEMAEIIEAE